MGFNIFLALSSPCPILVDTIAGSSIMVISTTLYMLFTTLLKEIISIKILCTRRHSLVGKFPMDNFFREFLVRTETQEVVLKIIKKVSFASVLRNKVNSMRLLLWFGAVTQIGSFCGAITSYPLVNCIEGIFVPRYDCQSCL